MSGIYIPGMEMPKGCATCPYCDRAWNKPKCKAKSVQGSCMEQRLNLDRTRQKWCPLVPVPPHGDLIDRKTAYDSLLDGMVMTGYQSRALDCISDFYVPTIIPASEEGE